MQPVIAADARAALQGKLLSETARHLAVRMSYEDVVRVAQAKIAPERLARIAHEELESRTNPIPCTNSSSPASKNCASSCRQRSRARSWHYAERKGWLGRLYFGMQIETTSVLGYLRFLMLAKLRPLRRYGIRYAEEQAQIEGWLRLVLQAAERSPSSRSKSRSARD